MTLSEKYEAWMDLYLKRFIRIGDPSVKGTNIPLEKVNLDTMRGTVGDGTINMAGLLQLLLSLRANGEELPVSIEAMLQSLARLTSSAWEYFDGRFPFLGMENEVGFFLRDDIDPADGKFLESTGLESVVSNYGMVTTLENEDPCHSAFVSQDQVWNLSPVLMAITLDESLSESTRETASAIGYSFNNYIKENGYTVYNPYLSRIYHFFTYLNLNVTYNERQEKRDAAYKPAIKVKRGANNWYYSGGTSAAVHAFKNDRREYKRSLRTFCYKGIVWFLDRIYEPVVELLGGNFKHNSIYCYAATSGVWYNGKFARRLTKRANGLLEKKGEMFEGNLLFLYGNVDDLDFSLVEKWLEDYPEPPSDGQADSPVEFLYIYNWYRHYTK